MPTRSFQRAARVLMGLVVSVCAAFSAVPAMGDAGGRFPGEGIAGLLPAPVPRTANEITIENALPGNPPSEWEVSGSGDPTIQGFATEMSVDQGETVVFKVATDALDYRIDVYRLGYYAGLGARKVATVLPTPTLPQVQPACVNEPSTGLIDCGNWAESAHWDVPADAVSGVYIARLVRTDTEGASHIVFIVRDDDGESDILFQTADTTWQAYNRYGGNSLYAGNPAGRAYKVSYNRPFMTRATEPEDWVFNAEHPMIRWLESNGYDVSYCSGIDTDRAGAEVLEHRVFLSVGHDEYWSSDQRFAIEGARDAGVHLAFFSGNEVFWKTRWEPSIDGSATPRRTMVCYKETHAGAKIDPEPGVWTGTWRDARFSPPADGGYPENALTGTIFTVNCCGYAIEVPSEFGAMRLWRNTGIDALGPGQVATLTADTLGYEWDEALDNQWSPPGLVRMSRTTKVVSQRILDNGSSYGPGPATHALTLFRAPSGALVFGAGTIQWSWGLDGTHDRGTSIPDIRIQQATVNLLADMGAQPETLQPGLIPATESTDVTPPTATILSPEEDEEVEVGEAVAISGIAVDGEGVVGAVEVSVDDGATWRAATGWDEWTFAWTPSAEGEARIRVRCADDSGNLSAPSPPVTVDVEPFSGCEATVWTDSATPASANNTDGQAIEIGMKFRSAIAGPVVGVRYYKGSAFTGTRIARLWTSGGTLLAEESFAGESASGWQRVNFDAPVEIAANTTYVVSVFSPSGHYAYTQSGLAQAVERGPLRALGNGEDGTNGVYLYTPTGGFPTQSYQGSNYWVDVVFGDCGIIDPPPDTEHSLFDLTPTVGSDSNDNSSVELGVKFSCDVAGSVTALRFYKHPANTGTHVGSLWTTGGDLLARVTFTGETGSGWQEQPLGSPVPLTPGQTYIASYHTTTGRYAFVSNFFLSEHVNDPLRAPASGASGGNGVYKHGASPAFPTDTFNASNYWVDVVVQTSSEPDTTPPTVTATHPANGESAVAVGSFITAVFSEPIAPATVTGASFLLHDDLANTLVVGSVSYTPATRTAKFTPSAPLEYSRSYTATLVGDPSSDAIRDLADNALAADVVWSFTTAGPPPPPPDEGPGGPILVVTSTSNPFGRYYAEILRAEGLNAFTVTDIALVTPAVLDAHEVVILSEFTLTGPQATMFIDWVSAGGRLIAMRPSPLLSSALGITPTGGTLGEGYMQVNVGIAPGAGIVTETMQYHGSALLIDPTSATEIAALYADATTPTPHSAVTWREVGTNGGIAAAWAYDLAKSIVYTRQGNPAWAGQERDGFAPLRSSDLFYGNAAGDPQPDWIDLNKVAIPQADEHQRLLANMIHMMMIDRVPMPRFWYFPRGLKAVVVMTGDDHANNGTTPRFNQYIALSDPGCVVEDWECVRGSSYIFLGTPISDAQAAAFEALGFEIGLHPFPACGWPVGSYATGLGAELAQFAINWPSVPPPSTNRTHCIAWSDWATQPKYEALSGIRLDTNYYYWPPAWVANRPGVFTGSGMPMRFADADGTMIDCYQVATQMTDESGQAYPYHADTLFDRALGPEGYYGAFCANMHTDAPTSSGSDAIIASAQARGVPVISARQLLTWVDGRNGSSFGGVAWDGSHLTFTIALGAGSRGIEAMVPKQAGASFVQSIAGPSGAVPFQSRVVKGVEYAVFPATGGSHIITYAAPAPCPGDVNGDGATNISDFNILAGNFGSGPGMTRAQGDLSGDGFVNISDFNILAGDFGCGG